MSYLRNVGVAIAQLASDNDASSGEVKEKRNIFNLSLVLSER
jgi:hypothetical protein